MPVSQDAMDIEERQVRLDNLRRLAEQLLNELDEDSRDRDADSAAAVDADSAAAVDAEGAAATPAKPAGWLRRLVG